MAPSALVNSSTFNGNYNGELNGNLEGGFGSFNGLSILDKNGDGEHMNNNIRDDNSLKTIHTNEQIHNANISLKESENIKMQRPSLKGTKIFGSSNNLHVRTLSTSSQTSNGQHSVASPTTINQSFVNNSTFGSTFGINLPNYYSIHDLKSQINVDFTLVFPEKPNKIHDINIGENNPNIEIGKTDNNLTDNLNKNDNEINDSEKNLIDQENTLLSILNEDTTDELNQIQFIFVQLFSIKVDIPVIPHSNEKLNDSEKSPFNFSYIPNNFESNSEHPSYNVTFPIQYKELSIHPQIRYLEKKDSQVESFEAISSDEDSYDSSNSKSENGVSLKSYTLNNSNSIISNRLSKKVIDDSNFYEDGNLHIILKNYNGKEKHFKISLFDGNELKQGIYNLDCKTGVLEKDLRVYIEKEVSLQQLDWLDRCTVRAVNNLEMNYQKDRLYLRIKFPKWKYPVMLLPEVKQTQSETIPTRINNKKKSQIDNQKGRNSPSQNPSSPVIHGKGFFPGNVNRSSRSISDAPKPNQLSNSSLSYQVYLRMYEEIEQDEFLSVQDFEEMVSNPSEEKHMQMSLNLTADYKNLKPNTEESKKLREIIELSPLQEMKIDQRELLWKFRYYLLSNKHALIKFLRIIDWENEKQVTEAKILLDEWAEMPSLDAIELLSSHFTHNTLLRSYAVKILEKADNETLSDILLELVQSLRYETDMINSDLGTLLLKNAESDFDICNKLYWYLHVERNSDKNPKSRKQYEKIARHLWIHLKKTKDEKCEKFVEKLARQESFLKDLDVLGIALKSSKGDRPKRIQKLRKLLQDDKTWGKDKFFSNISSKLPPSYLTIPLNPKVTVSGICSEKSTIFKSAKNPILLPFYTVVNDSDSDDDNEENQKENIENSLSPSNEIYSVIYKSGDDLRQDQLVIQMITLMDKLLKRNGLDLRLIPYKVLATSQDTGFVECITPNKALSEVISDSKGDIAKWIRSHNNPSDVDEAFNSFIRSCAGYSVITFILGVGDRHLDNILLRPNGQLFHIDFGFILGRDPKPFPPPIRLCKEMVTGMKNMPGDSDNENGFQKYIQLCCTSYNIIRRYSKLILNMFLLMTDANIPDLMYGNDPIRNIMKVEDKLNPLMSDAEASMFMKSIIHESERAIVAQITEKIHFIAQYVRS